MEPAPESQRVPRQTQSCWTQTAGNGQVGPRPGPGLEVTGLEGTWHTPGTPPAREGLGAREPHVPTGPLGPAAPQPGRRGSPARRSPSGRQPALRLEPAGGTRRGLAGFSRATRRKHVKAPFIHGAQRGPGLPLCHKLLLVTCEVTFGAETAAIHFNVH